MKKIYLCRHGETAWTITGQHTGRTDIPLTEKGKAQAKALRERIKDKKFAKIFVSPRMRAKETADGLNAEEDSNLVEWDYGDYEGLTSQEVLKKDPNWNLFSKKPPNGEDIEQVVKRADLFLEKVKKIDGDVAVFSHGHFLRVLVARYLGLEGEMGRMFLISVASLGILGQEHNFPAVALWNDTHHLLG